MVLDWDSYFLEMAKTASKRSSCLRAQVGAIIVGADKMIKATGYNGTPAKVESCLERNYCFRIHNKIPSGTRYETCRSIHAEQNAIIQAGLDRTKGAAMYIYGHDFICILCKRFILQAQIENIILKKDDDSPVIRLTAADLKEDLERTENLTETAEVKN
ncbi:MAG: deaminase [Candidatus Gastranaerophilales bacterium]|nr:deaminase [Candidatus Gastranaerophilales bacterium]